MLSKTCFKNVADDLYLIFKNAVTEAPIEDSANICVV